MRNRVVVGYCDYSATGEGTYVSLVAMPTCSEEYMKRAFEKEHGEFFTKGFKFVSYNDAPTPIKKMIPDMFLTIINALKEHRNSGLKLSMRIEYNLS